MRKFLIPIIMLAACNGGTDPSNSDSASAQNGSKETPGPRRISSLNEFGDSVLTALKAKDFETLSRYVHPKKGLRFSPYAYIDTSVSRTIYPAYVKLLGNEKRKLDWGVYDGSGEPMNLTFDDYYKKFIYDTDFLKAEKKDTVTIESHGNAPLNFNKIYPGSKFIEYYFSGFEEKYGGMDWRSLWLIVQMHEGQYTLVAVVHGSWTT